MSLIDHGTQPFPDDIRDTAAQVEQQQLAIVLVQITRDITDQIIGGAHRPIIERPFG